MRTVTVLCGLVAILLVAGGTRLAVIGTQEADVLRARADRQQTAKWMTPARRGEIIDTRGRVLAGTLREPSLFVDPKLVADARFAAHSFAPLLERSPADFEQQLLEWKSQGRRFVWLERRVNEETAQKFEQVAESRHLNAFRIRYEMTRQYPQQTQGPIAPHVLGFVGRDRRQVPDTDEHYDDLRGLAGVEGAYDDVLSGIPGRNEITVDRDREPVRVPTQVVRPAVDGATIVLTIDAFLQQVAQTALRKAVDEYAADWGTTVVMDPHSGEVLAMATVPDFDPAAAIPTGVKTEREKEALKKLWRNRAIADAYEPGSIFKPFVAGPALDDGLTWINEVFQIDGPTHRFGGRTIHDVHAYDALTLHEIISKSSNIGMGLLGARCGCDRLYAYVSQFGFGDVTGIGLPGEHSGIVLPRDKWNPRYSPQSVPIGQEISVTALQMVTAFSAYANGGLLLKPRVVRGVVASEGRTVWDNSAPVTVRRALDAETADVFRLQALTETVRSGTGTRAAVPGYQVFGKTGTAQVAEDGRYLDNRYVGSFLGGAPAEDPRVVVVVSIYKPGQKAYYGGTVAAPVAKEIIAETLAYLQVPKTAGDSPVARH